MTSQQPGVLAVSSMSHKTVNNATASNASSLSLDKFWSLPEELRSRIVKLACSFTTFSSNGAIMTGVDVATACALALTSPAFSQQANAMLWKAIKITRPTALISLWEAVAARPEPGLRIEHLYIGNDSNTPQLDDPHEWLTSVRMAYLPDSPQWPCRCDYLERAERRAMTRKRKRTEREKEGIFCTHDRFCVLRADARALQVIQRVLDIDLRQPLASSSGSKLYEAQAAHQLYLCHLQDVENAAQCRFNCDHRDCHRYPSLILTGFGSNTPAAPIRRQEHFDPNDKEWALTRDQVLNFLCQPGSPQDTFDHPLRLDCSHFDSTSLTAVGGPLACQRPPGRRAGRHLGRHGVEDDVNTLAEIHQEGQLVRLPRYDGTSPSAVRCLLALTPRLRSLALADSLLFALYGAGTVRPKSLRTLSIGPGRGVMDAAKVIPSFEGVELLHLCDLPPWSKSLASVSGLQQLKEIQWTMTFSLIDRDVLRFGVIVDVVVGRQGTSADEAAAAAAAAEWDPEEAATLVKLGELRARCFDTAAQAARLEGELFNVSRPVADCRRSREDAEQSKLCCRACSVDGGAAAWQPRPATAPVRGPVTPHPR